MWKYPEDITAPVFTPKEHITSSHASRELQLPETAVLFYMHSGEEFARREYPSHLLTEKEAGAEAPARSRAYSASTILIALEFIAPESSNA